MTTTPQFLNTPEVAFGTIVTADASGLKSVIAGGSLGTKVVGLHATSDDTVDRIIQIWINRAALDFLLGSVLVPDLSGTDGVNPTVNMFNTSMLPGLPVDNDGQVYINLKSGDTLKIKSTTTVTAAKTITATAIAGNF